MKIRYGLLPDTELGGIPLRTDMFHVFVLRFVMRLPSLGREVMWRAANVGPR